MPSYRLADYPACFLSTFIIIYLCHPLNIKNNGYRL